MADNKKIKLPQHLQLDSVSPATRLLEKRRLMYEVQKAFEDQKQEFQMKEKKFKLQEAELREKDILIQDNLIKFSTFLQQQEMRKKKDVELTKTEDKKIEDYDKEIAEKLQLRQIYMAKAEKIEAKVHSMKQFESFLEKVKDANPDEFSELIDILSRYKQLVSKNDELKLKQKEYADEHDLISKELSNFEKTMEMEQTLINNRMSKQQEQLESVDKEKSALLAQRDESTKQKSKKITETGQILMTIDMLYLKCETMKEIFPRPQQYKKFEKIKDFDNSQMAGEKSAAQLEIIIQCFDNFRRLNKEYKKLRNENKKAGADKDKQAN